MSLSRRYYFLMLSPKIHINVNAEHSIGVTRFVLSEVVRWVSTLCNGGLDRLVDVLTEDLNPLQEDLDVRLFKQIPPVKIVLWIFFYLFYVGEDTLEVCVFTSVMTAFGAELRFEHVGRIIGEPDAVVCHWCKVVRVHFLVSSELLYLFVKQCFLIFVNHRKGSASLLLIGEFTEITLSN